MRILKFIGWSVVSLFGAFTLLVMVSPPPKPSSPSTTPRVTVVPDLPSRKMRITKTEWRRSAGGMLSEMTLTVSNDNDYPVKDFNVTCRFFGKSGTEISAKRNRLYEIIPAGQTKRFRNLNFGILDSQHDTTTCEVDDARRA